MIRAYVTGLILLAPLAITLAHRPTLVEALPIAAAYVLAGFILMRKEPE